MSQSIRPGGFNMLPTIVKNLLIINGLFFLATFVFQQNFGINLIEKLGIYYPTSDKFQVHQVITHMFMHGGFGHLFFNMFALWMFGSVLENVWGPKRFLNYYLISALGAAGLHLVVNGIELSVLQSEIETFSNTPNPSDFRDIVASYIPENSNYYSQMMKFANQWEQNGSDQGSQAVAYLNNMQAQFTDRPTVGASGAVFALLLGFGYMFPNSLLYIYFLFPIKAKYFVILYGLFELYAGFSSSAGNIAHFAHLGGMLFGFILIKIWGFKSLN